jgi:Flp pilus assembly protein TadG
MQGARMHTLGSRRRAPRVPRRCAGQSVVEFSLISVVLLAMTFGIVDFGRAAFSRSMLTNALHEAVRAGIVASRSETTIPTAATSATCTSTTYYCGTIVAAAQQRSPSLVLTWANFNSAPGTIGCSGWLSSSTGDLLACRPKVNDSGNRLTVCVTYTFGLTAPRLLGLSTITMRECEYATLQ